MKSIAILLVLTGIASSSCSFVQARKEWKNHSDVAGDHFSEIPDFDFPIVVNDRVQAWLDYFQGRGRPYFTRYLERSGKYVPMMKKILREHGLPEDLVYLAMIESGFNPQAYSRARASGPWQFIYLTGKRYGLQVNDYIDERRDPQKATVAAAKYLKDLYDEFKDWHLAAAGYNAGEGKIRRGIKQYNTEDFWEMTQHKYLKSETKNYVPKIIAAALIAKSPKKYGFGDVQYEEAIPFDVIGLDEAADIEVIAKCASTSSEEIRRLNPELRSWMTPPHYNNYELKIPRGSATQFKELFAVLTPEERLPRQYHVVQRGEVLGEIARRYGVTARFLARSNDIQNIRRIYPGQKLLIPRHGASSETQYAQRESRGRSYTGSTYKVRRGDNPWLISQRLGLSLASLYNMNPGIQEKAIYPGQILRVKGGEARVAQTETKVIQESSIYVVQTGDSLWTIAQKFGLSSQDLTRWNPNIDPHSLRPGQRLALVQKHQEQVETHEDLDLAITKSGPQEAYKVESGDSLWTISKKLGVSIADLEKWNPQVSARSLRPGQTLTIKTQEAPLDLSQMSSTEEEDILAEN